MVEFPNAAPTPPRAFRPPVSRPKLRSNIDRAKPTAEAPFWVAELEEQPCANTDDHVPQSLSPYRLRVLGNAPYVSDSPPGASSRPRQPGPERVACAAGQLQSCTAPNLVIL